MHFLSLHSHTWASNMRFLDSINRPENLIDKALHLGFDGIAFTDHESLSAAITVLHKRDEIEKEHPDFKIIFSYFTFETFILIFTFDRRFQQIYFYDVKRYS